MYGVVKIMGRLLGNEQLHESELLIAIGQRVRSRRRELGLSMVEVARASGISRVTLQRVEEGKASVSAGRLPAFLKPWAYPWVLDSSTSSSFPTRYALATFPV
jgi:transcriptional regulator with XRE-family HTH domain